MRTIVDIPEGDVKALDLLGKKTNLSRAELVRQAVARYLDAENQTQKGNLDKYFGLFRDDSTAFNGMDGMAWQKTMRAEWNDRDMAMDKRLSENRSLNDQKQAPFSHKDKE